MKTRIGSATPIGKIIRMRPMAVKTLEAFAGHRIWENFNVPLGDFCEEEGLAVEGVLESLHRAPPAEASSDGRTIPAYHLIDRLTEDHRVFRDRDLPRLAALLDAEKVAIHPEADSLKPLQATFVDFDRRFRKHMEEEEEFLFPKIMRNEACFRYRELSPEVYKGSVNLYLSTQTHLAEEEFRRAFDDIRRQARELPVGHGFRAHLAETVAALEDFGSRLESHADLEEKELLPRAGRLEQELYAAEAPGVSVYPDRG